MPLSPESINDPNVSARDKITSWVANQGATTVLLLGIFLGVYQKGEILIDQVERGYVRNADDLLKVAKQRDETIDKLIAQWKDDRRLLIEILREAKESEVSGVNN